MTTISTESDLATLINVFTVEPGNQLRLIEIPMDATEVSVRRAPGRPLSQHRRHKGHDVRTADDFQECVGPLLPPAPN
jgi:hypothetical protein